MKSGKKIFLTILVLLFTAPLSAQDKKRIILTGLEVVPDVHTPASGGGEAWIESDTLYVRVEFENLMAPYFAANIHYGEEGEIGNPIYSLNPDLAENQRSGIFDPDKNKFALNDAMKEAFKSGNLYITISSREHQRAEIRGQIDDF